MLVTNTRPSTPALGVQPGLATLLRSSWGTTRAQLAHAWQQATPSMGVCTLATAAVWHGCLTPACSATWHAHWFIVSWDWGVARPQMLGQPIATTIAPLCCCQEVLQEPVFDQFEIQITLEQQNQILPTSPLVILGEMCSSTLSIR